MKKFRVRSLAIPEILIGIIFNTSKKPIRFPIRCDEIFLHFEPDIFLTIESLFEGIDFVDHRGVVKRYPEPVGSKTYYDKSFKHLRSLANSEVEYEIIGRKDEIDFLRKANPALYEKIESHIIWKGIKKGL